MKASFNIAAGTRVKLEAGKYSMFGTFEGTKEVKRTAKNYCDGMSTIQLASIVMGLVRWDENSAEACTVSDDDMRELDVL